MMAGCYAKYSQRECDANEDARIEMNLDQPRTQHNYTEIGFKKFTLDPVLYAEILKFYNENKHMSTPEQWPRANTYVNSWDSPTMMVSFENNRLRGGLNLKQKIWDSLQTVVEAWTGKKVIPTSLYGIREYKRGAVLATHVDRLPLVSSLIIQVAQEVDDPWPIEVYSHQGKAYNVTMKPGEAVLYESHTVLHGRPFPFNGTNYANIFVHYIPTDHDRENENDRIIQAERKAKPPSSTMVLDLEREMKNKLLNERLVGGHEQDNHAEHVVKRHLDKIDNREREKEKIKQVKDIKVKEKAERDSEDPDFDVIDNPNGRTALHEAAAMGDVEEVESLLHKSGNSDLLHARDENEWQAIHEAARGGHVQVLKLLIDSGADIGAQTNNGGTPLWWARHTLEEDHDVIKYLTEIDAPEGSEL
jgi:hypothetical protein